MHQSPNETRAFHRAGFSEDYWERLIAALAYEFGTGSDTVPWIDPADFVTGDLTQANFEQALHDAIDFALAQPTGGTVLIPRGRWKLYEPIVIPAIGGFNLGQQFSLRGTDSNACVLDWNEAEIDGPLIHVDSTLPTVSPATEAGWAGDPTSATWFDYSEWADFCIIGNGREGNFTTPPSTTYHMTGLALTNVLATRFRNITVRFCQIGVDIRNSVPGICQNLSFDNCFFGNGVNGVKTAGLLNGDFFHCLWNQNYGSDLVLGGANQISIWGGMMETANAEPMITTLNPNDGANQLSVRGLYHEGAQPTMLKVYGPGTTSERYTFDDITIGGFQTLFDLTNTAILKCGNLYGEPSSRYLTATGCQTLQFAQARSTPDSAPNDWNVDFFSRVGLEVAGQINRAPFHGSISRDIGLTELLTPYCAEIFDVSASKYRTEVEDRVGTLTGLLAGSVWTNSDPDAYPVLTTPDAHFNGQSSIKFDATASPPTRLVGTLATPIASGSTPGMFIVMRKPTPYTAPLAPWGGVTVSNGTAISSSTNYVRVGFSEDTGSENKSFAYVNYNGAQWNIVSSDADSTMLQSHATLVALTSTFKPNPNLIAMFDNTRTPPNSSWSSGYSTQTTGASIGNIYVGGAASSPAAFDTFEIAYLAVIKSPIPAGVVKQIMQAAAARFGLVLTQGVWNN